MCLNGYIYIIFRRYRWDFLENAYLYHVTRKDHRHNFSLQNVAIYMSLDSSGGALSNVIFIPQIIIMLIISSVYNKDFMSVLVGWFLLTLTFVTFNKVITSQYFVWFLSLVPFLRKSVYMGPKKSLFLILIWSAAQVSFAIALRCLILRLILFNYPLPCM